MLKASPSLLRSLSHSTDEETKAQTGQWLNQGHKANECKNQGLNPLPVSPAPQSFVSWDFVLQRKKFKAQAGSRLSRDLRTIAFMGSDLHKNIFKTVTHDCVDIKKNIIQAG